MLKGVDTPEINEAFEVASNDEVVWRLLAHGIPAQSDAIAVNPISVLGGEDDPDNNRNFHMPGNENRWTTEREKDPIIKRRSDWLHSDFRNVALPYTVRTYEKMLNIIEN